MRLPVFASSPVTVLGAEKHASRKAELAASWPIAYQNRLFQDEPKGAEMARHIVSTKSAPQSPLYAQGVRVGPHIWVSGMTGLDPASGNMAGPTIQQQTKQALTNCERIVEAGGGTRDDIVEVGVLLAHSDDFAGLNEAYAEHFPDSPPTRYVARLGPELPGVLVSIRMTALVE